MGTAYPFCYSRPESRQAPYPGPSSSHHWSVMWRTTARGTGTGRRPDLTKAVS